jgi:hypothetical protein
VFDFEKKYICDEKQVNVISGSVMICVIVLQDLLTFTEADIKDLGVKNSAHRARVVSSLVALRTKHEKGT